MYISITPPTRPSYDKRKECRLLKGVEPSATVFNPTVSGYCPSR